MYRPAFSVGLALGLALPATLARADIVVFTTGSAKEGIVVKESETTVRFQTESGVVSFPRSSITSITYSGDSENRELRQRWAIERDRVERERELRRAESRRSREAETASSSKERAEAEAAEREQRLQQASQDRERILRQQARWRKQQQDVPPDGAPASTAVQESTGTDTDSTSTEPPSIGAQPLQVEEVRIRADPAIGTVVTASLVNFGTVAHTRVRMDVELVENARTESEFVIQRRAHRLDSVDAESIVRIELVFGAMPTSGIEARIVNLEYSPGR